MMRSRWFRFARLSTIVGAAGIALSVLIGPAMVPAPLGGRVAHAFEVDIDLFRQQLSPYGEWFYDDRYGEVWRPVGLHRGWRPYYDDGHWEYSDEYGWMWVSDYPWGWAPFHYGRWAYTRHYGWVWVPGRQWGPAWVTFRWGSDAIGWAPLPPEANWDPYYGFRDYDYDDYYSRDVGLIEVAWSFVRPEGFLEPHFHRYAYDRRDYPRIIHRTKNITNITIINNRVVNRSIEVNNIERVTRKKVRRVRVEEADRPTRAGKKGQSVVIYKPVVVEKEEKGWKSRGDGLRVEEEQTRKKKKRRSDESETARQKQQVEPDVTTEELPKRKKKRLLEQQVEPSAGVTGDVEEPVKKKKKRRLQQQTAPSVDFEEPVKKKKRRAETQTQPDFEGTTVRKKKKKRAGSDADVFQRQQQPDEMEQPRRKKRKKCVGEDCPDGN